MTKLEPWSRSDVPDEIARMLAAGRATHTMPADVHRRVTHRLAITLASGTGFTLLGLKSLAAAATLCAASLTTVLITEHLLQPAAPELTSASAPHRKVQGEVVAHDTQAQAPALGERCVPHTVLAPASLTHARGPASPEHSATRPAGKPRRAPAARTPIAGEAQVGVPVAHELDLAGELSLLSQAHALLERDPLMARQLLHEHAQKYAHGQLAMEREVLILDVLDRLGKSDEARQHALGLLERARGTLYERRILARVHAP